MRIAYNMCVDHFRKFKRRPVISGSDDFDIFDVLESKESNAEQDIIRSQTHQKIRDILELLPPEQKEVVVLRHFADMSFKEIAQLTGVSINTALGRMRYALINMRKMVEERNLILQ
jgi:RNA polymerase, sigma subunit, ECF family